MNRKIMAPVATLALSGLMFAGVAAPAAQAAPPRQASAKQLTEAVGPIDVSQTIDGVGSFVGTFTPTGFESVNGVLSLTGVLNGEFTDATTGVVTEIVEQSTTTGITGAGNQAGCDILNLDLGPLELDVLGLVVNLSDVQLDITAVPGAGNLLGNLLCAVAGLLDGNATTGLANLLNRLLGL